MAALASDCNALITWVTKVYLDASKCSTYTLCSENIKSAPLLGKSFFSAGLFFLCFQWKWDAVLHSQECFKQSTFSALITLWEHLENTFIIVNNSYDQHFLKWSVVREQMFHLHQCSHLDVHPLTFWVTGWTWSVFLAWSDGCDHPSAACSYRPGTPKVISHV